MILDEGLIGFGSLGGASVHIQRLFVGSGAVVLGASVLVFQACGGSEDTTKKDSGGGGDSSMMADNNNPQPDGNMGMDTSDMDTAADVVMDSGPKCSNMPCVVGLAVGGHHACAIIVDGTVRCWGQNARGQLGSADAGAMNRSIPVQVDGVMNVTQAAASTVYTMAGSSCVRESNGNVLCFGDNNNAQLGMTGDNMVHPTAAAVPMLPMSSSVGLSNFFGCATTAANEYWCWGDNFAGALGRGMLMGMGAPGKATLLGDAGISSGSPGSDFNLAITTGGALLSWGGNGTGQLGRMAPNNGDPNPGAVQNIMNVTQVASGESHACAVTQAGEVKCWGDNSFAQLGRGIVGGTSNNPQTVTLPMGKQALQASASNYHSCVVTTDGSVFCWGRNNAGQVGPNTPDGGGFNPQPVQTPLLITLPGKALAVGVGGTNLQNGGATGYSCALVEGGSVHCWGYNGDAELGRGPMPMGVMMCNAVNNFCSPNPAPVVWQ